MLSILRNRTQLTTSLRKAKAVYTELILAIYIKLVKINLRILSIIKYLIPGITNSVRLLRELPGATADSMSCLLHILHIHTCTENIFLSL